MCPLVWPASQAFLRVFFCPFFWLDVHFGPLRFLCEICFHWMEFLASPKLPRHCHPSSFPWLSCMWDLFFFSLSQRFYLQILFVFFLTYLHGTLAVFCFICLGTRYGKHTAISLSGIICPLQSITLTNSSINMRILHFSHDDENIDRCPPWATLVWDTRDVITTRDPSSCPLTVLFMNNNGDRPWLVPWGRRCCEIIRLSLR